MGSLSHRNPLVDWWRMRVVAVIIGADANSHHTMWGSSGTNERGKCLLDFIISNNLVIANRGNEPTFLTSNRREALDITLLRSDFSGSLVCHECSFSDHRYISFIIDTEESPPKTTLLVNTRNINWTNFIEKPRPPELVLMWIGLLLRPILYT